MAPQGATAKYFTTEIAHIVDILTAPFTYVNNHVYKTFGCYEISNCSNTIIPQAK